MKKVKKDSKKVVVNKDLLDKAKEILGTETYEETTDVALDLVIEKLEKEKNRSNAQTQI